MEALFNQSTNFELLSMEEMGQVKGGLTPVKEKDVFDPDEQ